MANKILIPWQSLISSFLEPPANRRAAMGAMKASGIMKELVEWRETCLGKLVDDN